MYAPPHYALAQCTSHHTSSHHTTMHHTTHPPPPATAICAYTAIGPSKTIGPSKKIGLSKSFTSKNSTSQVLTSTDSTSRKSTSKISTRLFLTRPICLRVCGNRPFSYANQPSSQLVGQQSILVVGQGVNTCHRPQTGAIWSGSQKWPRLMNAPRFKHGPKVVAKGNIS